MMYKEEGEISRVRNIRINISEKKERTKDLSLILVKALMALFHRIFSNLVFHNISYNLLYF